MFMNLDPNLFSAPERVMPLIDPSKATTFVFPETVFTTVTAYQNQQVRRHHVMRKEQQILIIGALN